MRSEVNEYDSEIVFDQTRIWFYTPSTDALARIISVLAHHESPISDLGHSSVGATVDRSAINGVASGICRVLSDVELKEARVLATDDAKPSPLELGAWSAR